MLEKVMLNETIEMLRVNNQSVFDLLDIPFYQEDFFFVPQLAQTLGEIAEVDAEETVRIGILSEIIHLSSKIHLMIAEDTPTAQTERQQMQLPILVGDLLYGRFIHYLTEQNCERYLPEYLQYLKDFNSRVANEQRENAEQPAEMFKEQLELLTAVTVEVFVLASQEEKRPLLTAKAKEVLAMRWPHWFENKIMSWSELQALAGAEKI